MLPVDTFFTDTQFKLFLIKNTCIWRFEQASYIKLDEFRRNGEQI